MMRSLLRLPDRQRYRTTVECASKAFVGVRFTIRRMSLGRRIKLAEALRDLARQLEFCQAGSSPVEKVEAARLAASIDRVYLEWGLETISGLEIDGHPANADTLYFKGPEDLLREIVDRIQRECGLSDDDRKN